MSRAPLLRRFARGTATDARTLAALRARLRERGVLAGDARAWVGQLPTDPAGVTIPHERRPTAARRPVRLVLVAAAVGLLAAVIALSLPGQDVHRSLVATTPTQEQPLPGLALSYQGTGRLDGDQHAANLGWEQGTLQVALRPGSMRHLEVRTREAVVRVVGTRFEVVRDALGTHISVTEGEVALTCGAEPERALGAGSGESCAPVSGPALLGMARHLQIQGAEAGRILEVLDRAEGVEPPSEALAGELLAVRLEVLVQAGRLAEARDLCQRTLAEGAGARTPEIARLAQALEQRLAGDQDDAEASPGERRPDGREP